MTVRRFWLRSALFAVAVVSSAFAAVGQDRYADQWNVRGTAEEEESRFESSLLPTRFDERFVSDQLDRDARESRIDGQSGLSSYSDSESDVEPAGFDPFASRDNVLPRRLSEPAEPIEDARPLFRDRVQDDWQPDSTARLTAERVFSDAPVPRGRTEEWQMMPAGLLYHSYLAGEKEPRMQFAPLRDLKNDETYWEAVLGGRVGILRHGTWGAHDPQGFQIDLEGAVFARVLPNEPSAALAGSDYRAGILATWRENQTAYKAGYYHISSHVGDEYLLLNPTFNRINYVRDSLIAGTVHDLNEASRIYGEVAFAAGSQGGAKPLELQFGAEYTPPTQRRWGGAPYAAINGHIREEFDFNSGVNIVSGWNWQGRETGHRLRIGMQYYNGPSLTYQFFDRWESLLGGGLWFDY